MTLPVPSEWVAYLRLSQGYAGIARQRASIDDLAARLGGRVVLEFSDKDRTAFRNTHHDIDAPLPPRPDFARMLAYLAAHPGAGILAYHADRISRDIREGEDIITEFRRSGCYIATARGSAYDVTTVDGRDHFREAVKRAVYEVDHNTDRVLDAKAEYAAEGRYLGGGERQFGWRLLGDGLAELLEAEAQAVARGTRMLLAGSTVRAIARDWNDAGLAGTGGGRFTASSVHKILSSPRNAGLASYHGELVRDTSGSVVKTKWPAIVGEDDWRAAAAILSDPARKTNKGGTAPAYLLSGIALCGACGVAVVVNKSVDGTPRYRCSRHQRELPKRPGPHASRNVADVDAFIRALAVGRLQRDDARVLLREDRTAERDALTARRSAAEAKKRKDFELYQAGVIDDLELAAARKKTREDLAETGESLRALEAADVVAPFLADPARRWDDASLDQKRAVVSALMYVTLVPGAKYSRPPGWKQGDGQFDPRLVDVRWARRLPSDG